MATTCDGGDRPPTLRIRGVPPRTGELALIVSDPDAPGGTFIHWVVHGLPPTTTELGPNTPVKAANTDGTNDFNKAGWGGPCPPPGPAHHYVFELMALDQYLGLASGVRADALRAAAKGHVLQTARLTATYARR
ncbi:MAG: YbhB/YbcL family Raf kinase inhibitor-like protein [Acidimicrobiales bacterium]